MIRDDRVKNADGGYGEDESGASTHDRKYCGSSTSSAACAR
jgi:hypothetical protein